MAKERSTHEWNMSENSTESLPNYEVALDAIRKLCDQQRHNFLVNPIDKILKAVDK